MEDFMLPKEIIQSQKEWAQSNSSTGQQSEQVAIYIHFINGSSKFLIPISQVKEICEKPNIRAYPEPKKGHLGICNIHGDIIPILSMISFSTEEISQKLENCLESRIIVVSTISGESF